MEVVVPMDPMKLYPAVALFSIVTVEFGGWSLLAFLTGRQGLNQFQEQFFRAGHAHAGVLLVLSLVYFALMPRAEFARGTQWAVGAVLLVGILLQSGGFFLHMLTGGPDAASVGTLVTRVGGILLAIPLIALGVGLLRAG